MNDLEADSGTRHFAGHRLGCWINTIPANGLVLVPEASAGCACLFSLTSTVAFEPRQNRQAWGVYSAEGPTTPVKHLAINLGAPGDRRDRQGTLWFGYPRPWSRPGIDVPLDLAPEFHDGGNFRAHNSESFQVDRPDPSWVMASGARALARCSIPLLGQGDEPGSYRVRLYLLAEDDTHLADIVLRVQGRSIPIDRPSTDGVKNRRRAWTQEISAVRVESKLSLEFARRDSTGSLVHAPTLCGIEIFRQESKSDAISERLESRRDDRPNIIYILADDLGYGEVGCYGQTKIRTPSLDRMAVEGMRFTQHYSGSAVCAPSRCVLMTGMHTGHPHIRNNSEVKPEGQKAIPVETITIGELLREQGYTTGAMGKWGLGGPGTAGEPNRQGFDHWFGYICQRQAHNFYPRYLWRNTNKVPLEGNDRGLTGKQYSHYLMTDEALEFIRKNRDRPFFLYVPFTIPHLAIQVPDDSLAAF